MNILNINTNPVGMTNTTYKPKQRQFKLQQSKQQQGIGMVEVMVSLLLLSVAVLGFSAMQMTAIKSSESSMLRTRAMSVIRSGSEAMRANPQAIDAFKKAVNDTTKTTDVELKKCLTNGTTLPTVCSAEDLATRDGRATKRFAENNELSIAMATCPDSGSDGMEKECFIASWGKTTPKFDDTDTNACADKDGNYKAGATCFVMEAY